jgi:predicted MFS family arabinose efflux permease
VNLPIAVVTAGLALRLIDHDHGIGWSRGADVPGAVLITGALMLGVYTIVKPAAEHGWTAGDTLGLGAVSLVLLVAFVLRESSTPHPLMPMRIFRSRNVSGANLIQVLGVVGMFGMFFLGALYLQRVLGYDALEIGLAFLPVTVVMGLLSVRYTEPLVTRFGARQTLIPGLVLIVIGLALFSLSPVDGSYLAHVFPSMVLFGTGAGLCFPALMTLAMSGATPEDAGLASGLVNTSAQIGGALGLAVLATLSTGRSEDQLAHGRPVATALTSGYHLAFGIAAALVALAIVVALTVLRPEAVAVDSDAGEEVPEPALA